jgi:hypothetical protein
MNDSNSEYLFDDEGTRDWDFIKRVNLKKVKIIGKHPGKSDIDLSSLLNQAADKIVELQNEVKNLKKIKNDGQS